MNLRKNILFLLLLALMFTPVIQQYTGVFKARPLTGTQDPVPFPGLSLSGWTTGDFQSVFEQGVEERIGFRPGLIRIKNQIQYSLFKKANAVGVLVGKNRSLFEYDYIRAYLGEDYPGDWYWQEKFRRIQMVRDTLNELGTELVLVLEPGKASYADSLIPDAYLRKKLPKNNYETIRMLAMGSDLPFCDLNALFKEEKTSVAYPHYTRGGIHWSYSAMLRAVDTLLSFTDAIVDKTVPDMRIMPGEVSQVPRDTDQDLLEIMNLLVVPGNEYFSYPDFEIEEVPLEDRADALVISDSYYFNILNAGIPDKVFDDHEFWYYANTIYPDSWTVPRDTSMVNVPERAEQVDLIMLMITERFYYKLAWNFIERLYQHYYPDQIQNYHYDYIGRIITDFQWFDAVVADAASKGISLEEALRGHADYQIWKEDQEGRLTRDAGYYLYKISRDSVWSEQIRIKAVDNGISFQEQAELDAKWMAENDQ